MQEYFCGECKRYLPSEVCSIHGAEHTLLLGSEQHKEKSPRPSTQQENSPRGGISLVFSRQQQEKSSPPVPQVSGAATKASRGPAQFNWTPRKNATIDAGEILRFRESERLLHWAIAIPYMLCWITAVILVFYYNPNPLRPFRDLLAGIHRISGVCLIILPILVLFRGRDDYKMHFYNIKTAWLWSLNDLKWLVLMGLAAISKRIVLPEQGKFNAAEKVNFMSVMISCPFFVVTGIMIWTQNLAWMAWLVHATVAILVSPTMLGHIYMATVNPDTRIGLKGMISGYVDRKWAKHHYGLWYREHFERDLRSGKDASGRLHPPDHQIRIHCPACAENLSASWTWLVQQIISTKPLVCPSCSATFSAITSITDHQELLWIEHHLEKKAVDGHSRA